MAILFRSRTSHREFEHELELRGIPTYVYKGLGFFDADEIKDLSALMRFLADPWSDLRAAAFLRSRFVRMSDRGLAGLGTKIAAALLDPHLPAAATALSDEDRRVLLHVRAHVHRWLAQVDHVPPADLIEQLIPATAYAYELRGPRLQQAWENLKKMRGLVRRIQNRGYATLPRIADHIDSLTAGDESNAVIEALDAVNLMTVHAAKGLEFPVVFVVNLAKGATGPPRPIRVTVDGEGGAASVSVGPFVSESDEAEREREKHETRRLLYVALTRARDRLYLSSVLKNGVMQPGRGSLAEVLPDSVRGLFSRAATAFDECTAVGWAGPSGRAFDWRICRLLPLATPLEVATPPRGEAGTEGPLESDRFGPVLQTGPTLRVPVTRWLENTARGHASPPGRGDAIVGTLVHRLLQSWDRADHDPGRDQIVHARGLLRPEERAALPDVDLTVRTAIDTAQSISARNDVRFLLAGGHRLYEVPFSLRTNRPSPHAPADAYSVGTMTAIDAEAVVLEGHDRLSGRRRRWRGGCGRAQDRGGSPFAPAAAGHLR